MLSFRSLLLCSFRSNQLANMSASIPGLPPCPPPVPLHSPPPSAPSSSSSTAPPPPPSPKRKIFIAPDLAVWPTSEAYALVTQTILRLVYAVRGKSTGEKVEEGEVRSCARRSRSSRTLMLPMGYVGSQATRAILAGREELDCGSSPRRRAAAVWEQGV